eukprot:SM000180S03519  [mRNA]  locus=s180:211563:212911:- [translate_table: standard]
MDGGGGGDDHRRACGDGWSTPPHSFLAHALKKPKLEWEEARLWVDVCYAGQGGGGGGGGGGGFGSATAPLESPFAASSIAGSFGSASLLAVFAPPWSPWPHHEALHFSWQLLMPVPHAATVAAADDSSCLDEEALSPSSEAPGGRLPVLTIDDLPSAPHPRQRRAGFMSQSAPAFREPTSPHSGAATPTSRALPGGRTPRGSPAAAMDALLPQGLSPLPGGTFRRLVASPVQLGSSPAAASARSVGLPPPTPGGCLRSTVPGFSSGGTAAAADLSASTESCLSNSISPFKVLRPLSLEDTFSLEDLNRQINGPSLRRSSSTGSVPWPGPPSGPLVLSPAKLSLFPTPAHGEVHVTRLRTQGNGSITIKRNKS